MADTRRPAGVPAPQPAVRLAGLVKRYQDVTAVDGLELTVHQGEVVALLGPNGAGKSTAIDMLLGLTRPDAGTVTLLGRPPAEAVRAGLVGALLQSGGLLPDLTVREIVSVTAALFPRHRPVDQVMARAGITDLARRPVGRLSGGQQQRVRFAMALVADPQLVVLDEPTTGMDVEGRRAFWAAMRAEADRGRTVLFATHYLEEADAFADRVVLMRAGRVIAEGSAAQIKAVVSGRTIRATVPGADPAKVAVLPGVDHAETRGDQVLLRCSDADAALRALLATTDAHDIEVTARGLEDAFIALTTGGGAA